MKITVQELRRTGYKVQVGHYRQSQAGFVLQDKKNTIENLYVWKPKGGKTVVRITKDGVDGIGEARCHESDNYRRKTGVEIAIKAAFRNWHKNLKQVSVFVSLKEVMESL